MKKLLLMTLIFGAIFSVKSYAQTAPDPATMLQQMKERIVPGMVEKTGLTEAQANKVVEINFELRQSMAGFRDLNEADRAKKVAEMKVTREKRYAEIPLTAEQIKAVNDFYAAGGANGGTRKIKD